MPVDPNFLTPLLKNKDRVRYEELLHHGVKRRPRVVSIEEVVNSSCNVLSYSFLFLFLGVFTFELVLPSVVYFSTFGGFLPYNDWKCLNDSGECFRRTKNLFDSEKRQYNRENLCGGAGESELVLGTDFIWEAQAQESFAIQWDLFCDREFLQTMVGSTYFSGGLVGSLVGGLILDSIGRKRGTLIGYLILIVATFANAAAPSVAFLYVFRFFQGVGLTISVTGLTILCLEYVPQRYRTAANSTFQVFWSLGFFWITVEAAFFIRSWHWLAATTGFMLAAASIPLLLVPESPLFLLVNKNSESRAKSSLRWLISLNGSDFDLDGVELDHIQELEKHSFGDSMMDIWRHKALLVQIIILTWIWTVIGFMYYAFSFSWSSFGVNMYYSYMFAALAEFIAYVGMSFPTEYWGRRPSIITFFLVASVSCVVAMVPCNLSSSFSLEQLCCLVASMMLSASYGSVFVYSIELAPTSHRGKIMAWFSLASQVSACLGPQASLLFNYSRIGTLALLSVLAGSAGLLTFGLPDTLGRPTLNTAKEVQLRNDTDRLTKKKIQEDSPAHFL